ncbi:MAG TPA: hypothetical protein VJ024_02295 [Thermodesulfovibrionales bacterium]|nr:hypothetical protein [Thermodesulfovibrionales bacterium]
MAAPGCDIKDPGIPLHELLILQYEMARIQDAEDTSTVQVLDMANEIIL